MRLFARVYSIVDLCSLDRLGPHADECRCEPRGPLPAQRHAGMEPGDQVAADSHPHRAHGARIRTLIAFTYSHEICAASSPFIASLLFGASSCISVCMGCCVEFAIRAALICMSCHCHCLSDLAALRVLTDTYIIL